MTKKRILLVDDEVSFTQVLKANLEEAGPYSVRVENAGSRALDVARAFQPDLIFLDLIMPDLDGAEVARQIQADPPLKRIPIIFLTAAISREEAEARGSMIGGQTFMAKPVRVADVIACLERYLGPASP